MAEAEAESWTAMILSADGELQAIVNEVASRQGFNIQYEMSIRPGTATERHLDGIRRFRPDLVVIDFDEDSAAGCRLATRIVESASPGSVLATSWRSREVQAAATRAGVYDLLQKPVSRLRLEETLTGIRRRLTRREGRRSARRPRGAPSRTGKRPACGGDAVRAGRIEEEGR
ncbi:MAG: hypothetical protein KY397_00195 [Gemmatimonadetes bacterium]|nr:hypothetical protein [Gemmatimonadota bacterium]